MGQKNARKCQKESLAFLFLPKNAIRSQKGKFAVFGTKNAKLARNILAKNNKITFLIYQNVCKISWVPKPN